MTRRRRWCLFVHRWWVDSDYNSWSGLYSCSRCGELWNRP